ncbi:O-antigen ligase family protein [Sulfuriroseicoccus oceanibius]|uniref:O-antigen ligase family protein n=1 Tax=Sulfuriroseicoccus oceanibius TaxID=2707525 RepID=A0A6B3LBZ4_9BACT|nr:O-antigen ligase family protein [Sulfuriroseicoccus oceanibius]QQL44473.1 O-antigen ligase family protein [Sulfuriroseicoccus oceanibius]
MAQTAEGMNVNDGDGRLVGWLERVIALWIAAQIAGVTFFFGGALNTGKGMVFSTWMLAGLAVWFSLWWVCLPEGRRVIRPVGFLFVPWLAFLAVSNWVITPAPWVGRLELFAFCHAAVLFFVVVHAVRSARARWILVGGVLGLGLAALGVAVYQGYVDTGWHPAGGRVWEQYAGRSVGFFGNPNSLAALMLLLIPAPLYLALDTRRGLTVRVLGGAQVLAFFWCHVLTVSRGGVLAILPMLVLGGFLFCSGWKRRVGVAALLLVVYGLVFFGQSTMNERVGGRFAGMMEAKGESSRQLLYPAAWKLFLNEPIAGNGVGSFPVLWDELVPVNNAREAKYAHSDYLQTLADEGVIGFVLLYGPLFGLLVFGLIRVMRERDDFSGARMWLAIAVVGLCGFAAHNAVDFLMKIPSLLFLQFVMLAWIASVFFKREVVLDDASGARVMMVVCAALVASWGLAVVRPVFEVERMTYGADNRIYHLKSELSAGEPLDGELLQEASDEYAAALLLDERYVPAWAGWGKAKLLFRHLHPKATPRVVDDAVADFDTAMELGRPTWRQWADRGDALAVMPSRYGEAVASYQKALGLAPEHSILWIRYANLLIRNPAAYPQAMAALQRALEIDPGNEQVIATMEQWRQIAEGTVQRQ